MRGSRSTSTSTWARVVGATSTCDEWINSWTGGGALLTPTVAAPGWLADGRMNEESDVHGLGPETLSTAVQNITGHPALSLPFGHLPSGLPFGLQVTVEHYRDEALLDVADLFEREYPWRRSAPGYETLDAALDLE